MTKSNYTIILEGTDLRFRYRNDELIKFRKIWKKHRSNKKKTLITMNEIAEELGMTPDNVALLAIDQARKGKIQ